MSACAMVLEVVPAFPLLFVSVSVATCCELRDRTALVTTHVFTEL